MGNQGRRRHSDGMTAHVRHVRLEELIRQEIDFLFESEIQDDRLEGARVSAVELARDGSRARIWLTLEDSSVSEESRDRALQAVRGFARRRLCEALSLKRVPELTFRHDPGVSRFDEE